MIKQNWFMFTWRYPEPQLFVVFGFALMKSHDIHDFVEILEFDSDWVLAFANLHLQ